MSDKPAILNYLDAMNEKGASDLYLTSNSVPMLRVDDDLIEIGSEPMSTEQIKSILESVLISRQRHDFYNSNELNVSLELPEYGRFRVNVFKQKQEPGIVIRRIVKKIPSMKDLHLPDVIREIAMEKRGLVLLTGMTGSGKSTTLAAMIDYVNENHKRHIVTIEDPLEYIHNHKKSVVTQREVGVDTDSYATAMKNVLRQRPDVILVGEIRDREVMEQTINSAETGHLCLSTVHANNAYQAIERITNFFPDESAKLIRASLATNLKAIIAQRLLPGKNGGLVPALEIMKNEGHVKDLIAMGEIGKIREIMSRNTGTGMQTFDQSLVGLLKDDLITEEVAIKNADNMNDFKVMLKRIENPYAENPELMFGHDKPNSEKIVFAD